MPGREQVTISVCVLLCEEAKFPLPDPRLPLVSKIDLRPLEEEVGGSSLQGNWDVVDTERTQVPFRGYGTLALGVGAQPALVAVSAPGSSPE